MGNIFRFIARYHLFLLFAVFQSVALVLTFSNRSYHRSWFWNTTQEGTATILEAYTAAEEYVHLRKTNRALAEENARLRGLVEDSKYIGTVKRGGRKDTLQQYTYTAAHVINISFHKRNNYITIDRGFLHGIKPGQGVICPTGVVGVVNQVSRHYSSVIPLLHSRTRLSGSMSKTKHFGSVIWQGGNHRRAQMLDVPRQANIQLGDWVVSDTRSAMFPSGLRIGKVAAFSLDPESQSYVVDVRLSVDFASLQMVYVIDNLLKKEQVRLEESSAQEPE